MVETPSGPVELTSRQLEKGRKANVDPARFAAALGNNKGGL